MNNPNFNTILAEALAREKIVSTNADRIRAMTDEELAQTLYWLRLDALRLEGFEGQIETTDEILEWLKATVEEVDNADN